MRRMCEEELGARRTSFLWVLFVVLIQVATSCKIDDAKNFRKNAYLREI